MLKNNVERVNKMYYHSTPSDDYCSEDESEIGLAFNVSETESHPLIEEMGNKKDHRRATEYSDGGSYSSSSDDLAIETPSNRRIKHSKSVDRPKPPPRKKVKRPNPIREPPEDLDDYPFDVPDMSDILLPTLVTMDTSAESRPFSDLWKKVEKDIKSKHDKHGEMSDLPAVYIEYIKDRVTHFAGLVAGERGENDMTSYLQWVPLSFKHPVARLAGSSHSIGERPQRLTTRQSMMNVVNQSTQYNKQEESVKKLTQVVSSLTKRIDKLVKQISDTESEKLRRTLGKHKKKSAKDYAATLADRLSKIHKRQLNKIDKPSQTAIIQSEYLKMGQTIQEIRKRVSEFSNKLSTDIEKSGFIAFILDNMENLDNDKKNHACRLYRVVSSKELISDTSDLIDQVNLDMLVDSIKYANQSDIIGVLNLAAKMRKVFSDTMRLLKKALDSNVIEQLVDNLDESSTMDDIERFAESVRGDDVIFRTHLSEVSKYLNRTLNQELVEEMGRVCKLHIKAFKAYADWYNKEHEQFESDLESLERRVRELDQDSTLHETAKGRDESIDLEIDNFLDREIDTSKELDIDLYAIFSNKLQVAVTTAFSHVASNVHCKGIPLSLLLDNPNPSITKTFAILVASIMNLNDHNRVESSSKTSNAKRHSVFANDVTRALNRISYLEYDQPTQKAYFNYSSITKLGIDMEGVNSMEGIDHDYTLHALSKFSRMGDLAKYLRSTPYYQKIVHEWEKEDYSDATSEQNPILTEPSNSHSRRHRHRNTIDDPIPERTSTRGSYKSKTGTRIDWDTSTKRY